MKTQLGFIPDNISAISYVSMQMQPTIQHEFHDFQIDSTDNLTEELFKQRAEKPQKQQQKGQFISLYETNKKLLYQIKDSHEIPSHSQRKLKESRNSIKEKLSENEMIPELNESMVQKQEPSKMQTPSNSEIKAKNTSYHEEQKNPISVEDRLQTLNNQTNQDFELQTERQQLSEAENHMSDYEESHKLSLPKIDLFDKLHNQSSEQQQQLNHKGFRQNSSFSPSQKKLSSQSQYSMQLHNYIEEEANQQNSSPKSSENKKQSSLGHDKIHSNLSKNSSHSSRSQRLAKNIQAIQSQIQAKSSIADTPINLFHKNTGIYQFTAQPFKGQQSEHNLEQAIAKKLNNIQSLDSKKKYFTQQPQNPTKQLKRIPKKQKKQKTEVKFVQQNEQLQTDYSQIERDVKILQHRYESNLALLSDQVKQLIAYYEQMINDEERKELKKQIMMLQIQNHRAKINLRNASYTKRFNFISPIPRNNDKPLQFRGKFKPKVNQVQRLDYLVNRINQQKETQEQQEARLTLLTKYYNIIKQKTLTNNQQKQIIFHYDSKLGRYTAKNSQLGLNQSGINIQFPFTSTNAFDFTPTTSYNQIIGINKSSDKKKTKSPNKLRFPEKKVETPITQPWQKYNLIRYKIELQKQMMLENEVYNMGRLKRMKDENRMLKKQLSFVDNYIQHFQEQFRPELKKYQEMSKPKIKYQSFKILDQETPYTKSAASQDYYGNNRGMNNINPYRPDSLKQSPLKSSNLNNSLSQSKYTIKRDKSITASRQDQALSRSNMPLQNDNKSNTGISFFRKRVASPDNLQNNDYFAQTERKQLVPIKQRPTKIYSSQQGINISKSQKSLSTRSKNLLRFTTQGDIKQHISPIKSPRLRFTKAKEDPKSSKKVESEYFLSIDGDLSNK